MLSIEGSGKHTLTSVLLLSFILFFLISAVSKEHEKPHREDIGGPGPESAHLVSPVSLPIEVGPSHMVRLNLY